MLKNAGRDYKVGVGCLPLAKPPSVEEMFAIAGGWRWKNGGSLITILPAVSAKYASHLPSINTSTFQKIQNFKITKNIQISRFQIVIQHFKISKSQHFNKSKFKKI
jgi:hypothetical protein